MRSGARVLYLILSWLLVAGLVVQVFLAGLGVFDDPARFAVHRDFGYWLSILPVLMILAALVGGMGRRMALLPLAVFGLFFLQSIFVAFRTSSPMIAALHPVNGFVILLIAIVIGREAWLTRQASPA